MPQVGQLLVYPVKSLDPHPVESASLQRSGALELDRKYAIVDEDGEYVNGKRERAVHRLRSTFDPDARELTLRAYGDPSDTTEAFSLDAERGALNAWLTDYFGYPVSVIRDDGGMPDDTDASGPTVISRATIEAVAGWFDGVDSAEMERRLRPNVVIETGEPFWEDRLYADRQSVVAFDVGDATLAGVNPCQRCVVPTRDPDTGEETAGFRERFVEKRRETLPAWADGDWFDHYFRLMVNTRVPGESVGTDLNVDEEVTIGSSRRA